jgi:thioredoxin
MATTTTMIIVMCPNCGAKNRVDESRGAGVRPVCGRCKTPLDAGGGVAFSSHPVELSDATFEQTLQNAGDRPVLVDCWATWCPPCRMIAPTIDQLASESSGRWVITKLDVDHNPAVAQQFRIESIPTLLIFKRGQLVERLVGIQPKNAIVSRLQSHA